MWVQIVVDTVFPQLWLPKEKKMYLEVNISNYKPDLKQSALIFAQWPCFSLQGQESLSPLPLLPTDPNSLSPNKPLHHLFPHLLLWPFFCGRSRNSHSHFHHLFLFKILQIGLFHKNSTSSSEQWWSIPPTEVPKSQQNTLRNAQRWCRLSIFASCTICLCLIAHLCFAEQLCFGVCPFTCVFSYKILIIPLVPYLAAVLSTVFPLTSLKIFVEIHEPRLTPDPLIQTIGLKTTGLR